MSLWILADVILLGIVVFFGYHSMKKGFLKSSYHGISSFIALILVFSFHTPFQGYVENSSIGDTVREKIHMSVEASVYSNTDMNKAENSADNAKEVVTDMKLPKFMTNWINTEIETRKNNYNEFKNNLIDSVTEMIFPFVMQILSILLLYLIIRVLMFLIFRVLKLILELPVLNWVDKGLGMVIGGVNALLIIYIASALVMLLVPVKNMNMIELGINSTYIYKYFYYNNLITTLFL